MGRIKCRCKKCNPLGPVTDAGSPSRPTSSYVHEQLLGLRDKYGRPIVAQITSDCANRELVVRKKNGLECVVRRVYVRGEYLDEPLEIVDIMAAPDGNGIDIQVKPPRIGQPDPFYLDRLRTDLDNAVAVCETLEKLCASYREEIREAMRDAAERDTEIRNLKAEIMALNDLLARPAKISAPPHQADAFPANALRHDTQQTGVRTPNLR